MYRKAVPWVLTGIIAALIIIAIISDWLDRHPWGWWIVVGVIILGLGLLVFWFIQWWRERPRRF